MFFQKENSEKLVPAELVIVKFQNIPSLTEILDKYNFTHGLELRLDDKHFCEPQVKEIFDTFANFIGTKIVFNFTGCSFTGNVGSVISSFLNAKHTPSELKFYFCYVEELPGIQELIQSLENVPQQILCFDFDYGSVLDETTVSLLIDAIKKNSHLKKFSLNLDATDLSLNAAQELSECLEKVKHFILYANDCGIESQELALFEKINQLSKFNAEAVKEYLASQQQSKIDLKPY